MNKDKEIIPDVLEEYFDQISKDLDIIEIEENVKDIVDKLESEFAILYEHLLKFKFQKEQAGTSWIRSINNSSNNILEIINIDKSNYNILMNNKDKILPNGYKRGRNKAIQLNRLPDKTFPRNYYENDDFELNLILQRSYLKQYIIEHKPNEPHRQKIVLDEVYEKFSDC